MNYDYFYEILNMRFDNYDSYQKKFIIIVFLYETIEFLVMVIINMYLLWLWLYMPNGTICYII